MDKLQRRVFEASLKFERAEGEGKAMKLVGHAAVFNQVANITGSEKYPIYERVLPGAFLDSIGADDIRALFNHDSNYVLGRNKSGTLILREDEKGLAVEITPPDNQWARDLMVSVERGDITQMSFGFWPVDYSKDTVDGQDVYTLKKARLADVSPVTFPAYPTTDISARDMQAQIRSLLTPEPESEEPGGSPDAQDDAGRIDILRMRLELAGRA